MRLNAAVENMTQGLCMFDRDGRLVVCNDIYAKMYKLPAELARPGALYSDIVAHRVKINLIKGEAGRQILALSEMFENQKSTRIDEHSDGRLVRITRRLLQTGGWVATHDDITEQQCAARELDKTKRFLDFDRREHPDLGGGEGRQDVQIYPGQPGVRSDA